MENILNREPIQATPPVDTTPEAADKKPLTSVESEIISVPKSEWEAMKETVRLLEEGGVRKIPKISERVAKITLHEDKIVTKIGKSWMERKFSDLNKREEDRLYAKITTEDNKEHTVDFLDFLDNADRIICTVKKVDKKDASVVHGTFNTENLNPREVKNFNSIEAEDIEKKTDDDYTLEITSGERKGEQVTLNHLALNI